MKKTKLLLLGFPKKGDAGTGGIIVNGRYEEFIRENPNISIEKKDYAEVGLVGKTTNAEQRKTIVENLKPYDAVLFDGRAFPFFLTTIGYIKSKLDIKVYAVLHHFLFMQYSGVKQWGVYALEMSVLSRLDGIIYSGIYPYELSKKIPFLDNEKIRYMGIGFEKETLVKRDASSNNNIVFIGHIIPRKGVHYLIKALILLKQNHGIMPQTYIIGDNTKEPAYTESLEKMIRENGMSDYVKLTGRIDDEQKEEIVRNSGLFVFPSLCEGYGMVLLETMKYGIPAIVFNNTNLPYIVDDGKNGYVVKNKEWKEIYQKLVDIYKGDVYEHLSKGAEDTYENIMTWDDVRKNVEDWLADNF